MAPELPPCSTPSCGRIDYDLILTGVQAEDGAAQVGGMLAAMLDYPFASLVTSIEVLNGKLKVSREIEGGNKEMNEIDLPCVLSIQTGINEPRYVGMRGIRQVASLEIPEFDAAALAVDPASVGKAGRESAAHGLLRACARQGSRNPRRQQGRGNRQSDRVGKSQRRVEIMARIFAYIAHKGGVPDDSAAEFLACRKNDRSRRLSNRHRHWFRS